MDVTVHWQDADDSSAKSVREIYPDAQIMICGSHAGQAHRNIGKTPERQGFDPSSDQKV